MFGTQQLLERKLRKTGKTAWATVLASQPKPGENHAGSPGASSLCNVTIRVEPDGEPPFEARTDAWLIKSPREGDVFSVLYDPADHVRLFIDRSDAAMSAAFRERTRRRTSWPLVDPHKAGGKGRPRAG